MKFRPGDLVEVIGPLTEFSKEIGKQGAITRVWVCPVAKLTLHEMDTDVPIFTADGLRRGWHMRNLRLRRPPSWDAWLTDTSHVRDEREQDQGVGA